MVPLGVLDLYKGFQEHLEHRKNNLSVNKTKKIDLSWYPNYNIFIT